MNSISISNIQLSEILNNFKDEILSNDLSKLNFRQGNVTKDNHYFCSIDLLNDLKNKEMIVLSEISSYRIDKSLEINKNKLVYLQMLKPYNSYL